MLYLCCFIFTHAIFLSSTNNYMTFRLSYYISMKYNPINPNGHHVGIPRINMHRIPSFHDVFCQDTTMLALKSVSLLCKVDKCSCQNVGDTHIDLPF